MKKRRLKIRVSVVRFRPWPPLNKVNRSPSSRPFESGADHRTSGPCADRHRAGNSHGEELMKAKTRVKTSRSEDFAAGVGRALRRAAKDARKIARMYGTPIYVLKNGKVVAEKP